MSAIGDERRQPGRAARRDASGASHVATIEARLRRVAERQLLAFHRNRRRDKRAHDYGEYTLVDQRGVVVFAGKELGDIALFLGEEL